MYHLLPDKDNAIQRLGSLYMGEKLFFVKNDYCNFYA